MTTEKLKELHKHTEDIIQELKAAMTIEEAINWADLKCDSAELCQCLPRGENETYESWRVVISEASPDAGRLQQAIFDGLRARGWEGYIEVTTEW